jgi:two-component system response regulator FixJ
LGALNPLPKKVCVVDDDEAVRDSMQVLLESYGIAVEGYSSAREFLPHSRDSSDCVLLDLHMPEMDGLQLLGAIREQGSSRPVIMITGRGDDQLNTRARQAGAYTLLNKPVEDDLLLQSIACAVAAGRAQNPPQSAAS